jgi:Chaperone of endosialidase
MGDLALLENTTGGENTAVGNGALLENTTGTNNTAVGRGALPDNTTGESNTAVGDGALLSNEDGNGNTAIGLSALALNTDGGGQTAVGYRALRNSSANGQFCFGNTAVGFNALEASTDGCSNTAIGGAALGSNTTGSNNVAVGLLAGSSVTSADNVICIGATVGENTSNSCFIGNIWNQSGGSQAVYVNADGKLGAQVSSRRFKDEIKPIDHASEAIHHLRPVSFRYKAEIEPARPVGFGLIAEEVEEINPDLVSHGRDGKPFVVRYDAVNVMLLNEFLKEHHKNEEQAATIARLAEQVEVLTAGLQKVSAQLQLSEAAPQTALKD